MTPAAGRTCAAVGALGVLGGFSAVGTALATGPGLVASGYVSEAGTAGSPLALEYRVGLLVLAAGVILLGAAFRPANPAATVLLTFSGLGAGVSGAVSCSAGCPLPPYEAATPTDLVHGGAAILGMIACVLTMALLTVFPAVPSLRSIPITPTAWTAVLRASIAALRGPSTAGFATSRPAAVESATSRPAAVAIGGTVSIQERRAAALGITLALPLAVATTAAMLFVGRGALAGLLERALLTCVVAWLITAAILRIRATAPDTAPTAPTTPGTAPTTPGTAPATTPLVERPGRTVARTGGAAGSVGGDLGGAGGRGGGAEAFEDHAGLAGQRADHGR